MPKIEHLGALSLVVTGERGRIFAAQCTPTVIVYRFEGYLTADLFEPSMTFTERAIARKGSFSISGDGELWNGYESSYRVHWQNWFRAHRDRVSEAHLLVRSAIVRMGLQVVNLAAASRIVPHASRASYDAAITRLFAEYPSLAQKWRADTWTPPR